MKMVKTILLTASVLTMSSALAEKTEMTSAELLSRIHAANVEEIGAAQLAFKKSVSMDVQRYAEHLEKDHKKADQLVMNLAKQEGVKLTDTPAPKSMKETRTDIAHTATVAELRALPAGASFDKAFVDAMENGHKDVIKMLKNAGTTDPKVKSLVAQLLPKLEMHEQMASKLESQIKEAR